MKLKKTVIGLLLIGFVCAVPGYQQVVRTAARLSVPLTMVIDAGHGGMDGGASASDGTKEQQINLNIAKALKTEAERYGVKVILTRETEEGLYQENDGIWSKVGDMKQRRQIIEETEPDLTISIHLNSFLSDSTVHGAQVFYPDNEPEELEEENKLLAEEIQTALKEDLGENADRIVLQKSGFYLFQNANHPMILVECGFLSNPDDLQNLKMTSYQQKLAAAIMKAAADHYDLKEEKEVKGNVVDSRTEERG